MSASIPAQVNPSLLVWARRDAGFDVVDAARRSGFKLENLLSWESGDLQPSLRQAEKLARLYDRPFSLFSLPSPPELPSLSSECRRLPGVIPGEEGPELRRAIRGLVRRRQIGLHLLSQLGDQPIDFSIRAQLSEGSEAVGARLRETLGISLTTQFGWPNEFVSFRAWRDRVESLGVLVCQFPGKDLEGVRGTSILHFPLPVVSVSSKEIPLSKAFTLLHEVVHLALAATQEEKPAQLDNRPESDWLVVERFCEAAASAALMPSSALIEDSDVLDQVRAKQWEVDSIRRTARRFRVTPTAVATRLLWLDVMKPKAYQVWKNKWEAYQEMHPARAGFGIATPAEKAVTRAGPMFSSLVLGALSSDRISSVDASHYLEVGFQHVEKLRKNWTSNPHSLARISSE